MPALYLRVMFSTFQLLNFLMQRPCVAQPVAASIVISLYPCFWNFELVGDCFNCFFDTGFCVGQAVVLHADVHRPLQALRLPAGRQLRVRWVGLAVPRPTIRA
jgi:hypothetical protein